jgi:hypothetical protein
MMSEWNLADLRKRMDGAVEVLRREFAGLRTGRASASLLEPLTVPAYGSEMPLNQVGTISVPEPRMLAGGEIGQGRGQILAVLKLVDGSGSERHRRAGIEQNNEPCIGLAQIAFYIGAFGPRINIPVDESRIVAFGVGLVLGELLTEAKKRRPMHAGQESLDDRAGDQVEIRQAGQHLGRQQVPWCRLSRRRHP